MVIMPVTVMKPIIVYIEIAVYSLYILKLYYVNKYRFCLWFIPFEWFHACVTTLHEWVLMKFATLAIMTFFGSIKIGFKYQITWPMMRNIVL